MIIPCLTLVCVEQDIEMYLTMDYGFGSGSGGSGSFDRSSVTNCSAKALEDHVQWNNRTGYVAKGLS
jgi:hypothetical protein